MLIIDENANVNRELSAEEIKMLEILKKVLPFQMKTVLN